MEEASYFKLILKNKQFLIPSDFRFINDVNPKIYNILFMNHEYEVHSDVNDNIFQLFINNWVKNEAINLNYNNISQFELLSQEFHRIDDLIKLYKLKTAKIRFYSQKNDEMKTKIEKNIESIDKKKSRHQKVIEILFNTETNDFLSILSENKNKLIEACQIGDYIYVDIYTRKRIEKDGLVYILNKYKKTVGLFSDKNEREEVFVPHSIQYKNQELIVTDLSEYSFINSKKIKSIKFSDDSALKRIGKYAFSNSTIESILVPMHVEKIEESSFTYCNCLEKVEFQDKSEIKIIEKYAFSNTSMKSLSIPSSVVEIQEGSFSRTSRLRNVKIMENEVNNYKYYEDSFILTKSSQNQDDFDILFLARRDIENVKIPSFIKRISSYAFQNCTRIKNFEFSTNSQLKSIGEWSFVSSSIKELLIPSHVSIIDKYAFLFCKQLKKIEFEENAEIKVIGKKAFSNSSLETLSIPSDLTDFEYESFNSTNCLTNIKIIKREKENFVLYKDSFILKKSSQNKNHFDVLIFARRDIEKVIIPSFVTKIDSYAFLNCSKINQIEFAPNSELITISDYAFSSSSIENIVIPSSVCEIGQYSFSYCKNLKKVEFLSNSNLVSIEKGAFASSSIESITFSSGVSKIENDVFASTTNLVDMKIFPTKKQNYALYDNSLLIGKSSPKEKDFDIIIKAKKNIEKAIIPSNIKKIISYAFYRCTNLKEIEFSNESELISIQNNAFTGASIENIVIPSHVKTIGSYSFACPMLKKIEFQKNSELELIDEFAFNDTKLESISIPSNVVEIKTNCFCRTPQLNQIKVIPNKIQNIAYYNDSFIIGKSSLESNIFDIIIVARRNIEKVIIPSFIKKISPYSFFGCCKIKWVEFSQNSELVSIGNNAFAFSSISSIFIPKNVEYIDDSSFGWIKNLQIIEIDENSKLKSIKNVFNNLGNIIMIPNILKSFDLFSD